MLKHCRLCRLSVTKLDCVDYFEMILCTLKICMHYVIAEYVYEHILKKLEGSEDNRVSCSKGNKVMKFKIVFDYLIVSFGKLHVYNREIKLVDHFG